MRHINQPLLAVLLLAAIPAYPAAGAAAQGRDILRTDVTGWSDEEP